MTSRKRRLTVTVDPELIEAGQRAVADGHADSVSSWVSTAVEEKIRRDRKLDQLAAAVTNYEREFGEITAEELAVQRRLDRAEALVVRGHVPDSRVPDTRAPDTRAHDTRSRPA